MNEALVVILALMWALVLLPGAIRSRRSSLRTTVGGFEHAMDVLAHHRSPQGRELMVPRDATRIVTGRAAQRSVIARRRRAFTVLATATIVSLLLGVLASGPFWLLFFGSAAALGSYVTLLLRLKTQRQQASRVVRQIIPEAYADDVHLDQAAQFAPEYAQAAVGAEAYGGLQVATRPDEPWQSSSSGVRIRRWDA